MSNTLIVRDATLAINGVSTAGHDPEERFRGRVAEAQSLDRGTVVDCTEVLRASAGASGGDPDVLEALVVIALAHPDLSEQYDLSPHVMGRRLAARLERTGEAARALAVLRVLLEHFPGNDALEREMAALMRRQGMVQDLADRYLERAERLLAKGQDDEAIAWFREVLLLDRSRNDVARRIRDLKYEREERVRVARRRRRLVLVSMLLSASVVAVVRRESDLREAYDSLPQAHEDDVEATERRLAQVERFVSRYPVWLGAFDAVAERSRLRAAVDAEGQRRQARAREQATVAPPPTANERADLLRERAINRIYGSADYEGGLALLLQALQLADDNWADRQRTLRDIEAIEGYLKEKPSK